MAEQAASRTPARWAIEAQNALGLMSLMRASAIQRKENHVRKCLRVSGPGCELEESDRPNLDETVVTVGKVGKTDDVEASLMLTAGDLGESERPNLDATIVIAGRFGLGCKTGGVEVLSMLRTGDLGEPRPSRPS